MRARVGNFLFRYRNAIGSIVLVLVLALALSSPSRPFDRSDLDDVLDVLGVLVALVGQGLRIFTIDSLADMRFNWRRVVVKEYNTFLLLVLSLAALRLWSEYRIAGIDALPSDASMATAFAAWLLVYLGVRTLKKRGWVRG